MNRKVIDKYRAVIYKHHSHLVFKRNIHLFSQHALCQEPDQTVTGNQHCCRSSHISCTELNNRARISVEQDSTLPSVVPPLNSRQLRCGGGWEVVLCIVVVVVVVSVAVDLYFLSN